ncbi:MAG: S8 family serine peptidase [Hyphomonadaceae bacterium]|nr:S8 family serine peptidase [Hyphomonadaceae bacterium]
MTPKTSIRWAALGASMLALCACEMFQPAPPLPLQIEADAGDVVDDQQIVVLARTSAAAFSLTQKSAVRGYVVESQEELTGLDLVLLVMTIPANMPGDAAIRELESMEPGVTAGVNHAYRVSAKDGSGDGRREYAGRLLGWPDGGCRANAVIGLIDAAADASDPGLTGVSLTFRDFTGTKSGPAADTDHGTVTAQILAGEGRLAGVRLQNAGVLSDHRMAKEAAGVDSLVRAIDWMQVSDVRLVNISLAGPYNKILDRSLQQAIAKGMIIVAAAGNNGPESPPRYPAAFDGVIAVTAIDVESKIYDNAVRGAHIDFAAPGVDVFVLVGGEGEYVTGTSVAAPYVTARIAADPRALSAKTAGETMKALVESSADLGAPGRDVVYGYGLPILKDGCGTR